MEEYNGLQLLIGDVGKQFIAIIVVFVAIMAVAFAYNYQVRKHGYDNSTKFMVVIQQYIYQIKVLINDIMGPKFIFMGPYILMLATILLFSNTITVFTFQEPTSSFSVSFTLALGTWIITQAMAIRYQKWSYIDSYVSWIKIRKKKIFFIPNPLSAISVITPLVSLSIRLWGNILSGVIITSLIHWALENLVTDAPWVGLILIGGPAVLPGLLLYFSLFSGAIQAFVFVNLTLTYWSIQTKTND